MATKAQLTAAVASIGASIDWENSYISPTEKYMIIDAPNGELWVDSESNVIVQSWYSGPASEFYEEILERVEEGLC